MAHPTGRAPVRAVDHTAHLSRQVSVTGLSGRAINVRLSGSLDESTAPDVARALQLAAPLEARPSPVLVLDLSALTFLDSAGLDVLLRLQQRLLAAGGGVELLGPSTSVIRMLHEAEHRGSASAAHLPSRPRFSTADG